MLEKACSGCYKVTWLAIYLLSVDSIVSLALPIPFANAMAINIILLVARFENVKNENGWGLRERLGIRWIIVRCKREGMADVFAN